MPCDSSALLDRVTPQLQALTQRLYAGLDSESSSSQQARLAAATPLTPWRTLGATDRRWLRPGSVVVRCLSEKWIPARSVEASVVVDPTVYGRVDRTCPGPPAPCSAPFDSPDPRFSTHLFQVVVTHRRKEVDEDLADPVPRAPWTKRAPQEVKPLVGMG